jgi:hypothetical protein
MDDIRMGDANGNGDRLHVEAYHVLRCVIHAHIASGQLPILGESERPTSGYKTAIARDRVLKQVILANMEYVKNVRLGKTSVQLPTVQDFTQAWPFISNVGDNVGWLNNPVAE